VEYLDTALEGHLTPAPFVLPRESVRAATEAILGRLQDGGLLSASELDWSQARWGNTEQAQSGGTNEPVVQRVFLQSTLGVRRVLNGTPVANNGVRVAFNNSLQVTHFRILWRQVRLRTSLVTPERSWAEAEAEFSAYVGASNAKVLKKEIAYIDGGRGHEQRVYEPAYAFVFQSELPIGRGRLVSAGKRIVWHPSLLRIPTESVRLYGQESGPAVELRPR
jgi:hypothetical protein